VREMSKKTDEKVGGREKKGGELPAGLIPVMLILASRVFYQIVNYRISRKAQEENLQGYKFWSWPESLLSGNSCQGQ